jgi:hypothetical protein
MADDPITKAVTASSSALTNIPFVEFTTDLVRNIFKTVVDSTLEQLEAFAELVSSVSGTFAQYESSYIGATPAEQAQIAESYITDVLALPAATNNDYVITSDVKTALISHFGGIKADHDADPNTPPAALSDAFDASGLIIHKQILINFVIEKLKSDARLSYDKLIAILKLGLAKIVITDGEIKTKLMIHVEGIDSREVNSTTTSTSFSQNASSWGVAGNFGGNQTVAGRLGKGKLAGAIIRRSLGGNISGGISQSSSNMQTRVTVVNEKSVAATNIKVDIIGEVRLAFRSDFFQSIDPSTITG